jgi:bifunctional non-homologous end joining protein LigD
LLRSVAFIKFRQTMKVSVVKRAIGAARPRFKAKAPSIPQPEFVPPMQAKLVRDLPQGDDWIYEIKWDGYRIEALKHGDEVRLISRNEKNHTAAFPQIRDAVAGINAHTAVLDGEIVALDDRGRPSFEMLQHRTALASHNRLVYFAFDLLNLNGKDLCNLPLDVRKKELAKLVAGARVQLSADLEGDPAVIIEAIKGVDLEGLVAKRCDSRYEPANRSGAWVKVQFKRQQEFVIGGYKPDGNSFSSIAAGYYDNGKLMFAGKVRAGFNPYSRRELLNLMQPLKTSHCGFADLPSGKTSHWGEGMTAEQMAEMQWLKPKLVCQVRFTEWTRDAHLRHADYLGLRTDKKPEDVVREHPSSGV